MKKIAENISQPMTLRTVFNLKGWSICLSRIYRCSRAEITLEIKPKVKVL